MQNYYSRQATLPHFSGHARQRGSGIGSLALGSGTSCVTICQKSSITRCQVCGQRFTCSKSTRIDGSCLKEEIFQTSREVSSEENSQKTSRWKITAGIKEEKQST